MFLRNNCDILDCLWALENINKSPYLNSVQSGSLKSEFQRWQTCKNHTQALELFQIFKRVGNFRNWIPFGKLMWFFFFLFFFGGGPWTISVKCRCLKFSFKKGIFNLFFLMVCSHYAKPEMSLFLSRNFWHRQAWLSCLPCSGDTSKQIPSVGADVCDGEWELWYPCPMRRGYIGSVLAYVKCCHRQVYYFFVTAKDITETVSEHSKEVDIKSLKEKCLSVTQNRSPYWKVSSQSFW